MIYHRLAIRILEGPSDPLPIIAFVLAGFCAIGFLFFLLKLLRIGSRR